jgi:hypothetical protein
MKEEGLTGSAKTQLVGYTRSQVQDLADAVGLTIETTYGMIDLAEHIVVCRV